MSQYPERPFIYMGDYGCWSRYNLGSTNKYSVGTPFAWGETETKEEFTESNYKFYVNGNKQQQTKYCCKQEYWAGDGYFDGLTDLEREDDPATQAWGPYWITPNHSTFWLLCTGPGIIPLKADGYSDSEDGYVHTRALKLNLGGIWGTEVVLPAIYGDENGVKYWTSNNNGVTTTDRYNFNAIGYIIRQDNYEIISNQNYNKRYTAGYIRPYYVGPHATSLYIIADKTTISVGESITITGGVKGTNGFDYEYDKGYPEVAGIKWNTRNNENNYIRIEFNENQCTITGLAPGTAKVGISIITKLHYGSQLETYPTYKDITVV